MTKSNETRISNIGSSLTFFDFEELFKRLSVEISSFLGSDFVLVACLKGEALDFSLPFVNNLEWSNEHVIKKIEDSSDEIMDLVYSKSEQERFLIPALATPYEIFLTPMFYQGKLLGVLFLKDGSKINPESRDKLFELLLSVMGIALYNLDFYNRAEQVKKNHMEFVAGFSHEFKVPLNVVVGFSDLLFQKKNISEEKKQTYLKHILNSAHHMLQLVQGVLDISVLEYDLLKPKLEKVHSKKVMAQLIDSLELLARKKNLMLNLYAVDVEIFVELKLFKQLIYNLVQNAIKYAYEGTEVNIFSYVEGDKIFFEVENKGPKIKNEDSEKIFSFLGQAKHEGETYREGSGIGLALCKKIVLAHGGEIKFCCSKDEKTTFLVILPYEE